MEVDIKKIIEKSQMSDAKEEKYLRILAEIYEEVGFERFFEDYTHCLDHFLSHDYKIKNSYVQRGIKFMAKFATCMNSNAENSKFLVELFTYLLKLHNCTSSIWRYRVCEFIATVLSLLQDCFLDDNICDEIINAMTIRLSDSISAVKVEAARALERLQDPTNQNDIVIQKYIENIKEENSQVRKQMILSLANGPTTYLYFMDRILDVDAAVREAAYSKLAKGSITWLRIEHRQYVLRNLFKNSDPKVNATNFVYSWFKNYNRTYLQFLAKIKLDSDENDMWSTLYLYEKILEIFFKNEPLKNLTDALQLDENKVITSYELIFEIVVYWRCFTKYVLAEMQEDNYIDEVRPVLLHFCEFMKRIYDTRSTCTSNWKLIQHDFVMHELIKMVADFDMCDEVGRRALSKFLTDVLTDAKMPMFVIMEIEKIFEELIPEPNKLMETFCTIISEIREPVVEQPISQEQIQKRDLMIAALKVSLDIARDERDTAVEAKKFDIADKAHQKIQEFSKEIEKINSEFAQKKVLVPVAPDVDALITCMDIFTSVMLSKNVKTMPPSGMLALKEFIIPHIAINASPKLVAKSLKALALCCYVDKKLADEHIYNFCFPLLAYKYAQNIDVETLLVAMPACVDFALLYGPKVFITENNTMNKTVQKAGKRRLLGETLFSESGMIQEITFEDVVESMLFLLNDEDAEISEVSGKCLVKILKNGLIHCPNLITQLLIKWFHPNTMTLNHLSQLLGDALSYYAEMVQGSLEIIVEAFIPTINVIMNAPAKSPLLDINVDNLSKFMLALCDRRRHIHDEGLDCHRAIAMNIFQEIRARPTSVSSFQLVKILIYLSIPDDDLAVKELKAEVETLLEVVTEKKSHNWLLKYKQKLEGGNVTSLGNTNGFIDTLSQTSSGSKQTESNISLANGPEQTINQEDSGSETNVPVKKKTGRKLKQKKVDLNTIVERSEESETSSNESLDSIKNSDLEKTPPTKSGKGKKRLRKRNK